jgi:uncharacterized cupredoxin-like copper-binding protein
MAGAFATALCAAPVLAHEKSHHANEAAKPISTEVYDWGQQGDAKRVTRTIVIAMSDDMRFTPSTINVTQGETIKFVVTNKGKILHEMVIGTAAELAKHAALMKKHPNMEHDEPFMAHVAPTKKTELIWQFSKVGAFEFACLIPGHFEAGMRGTITVAPRT